MVQESACPQVCPRSQGVCNLTTPENAHLQAEIKRIALPISLRRSGAQAKSSPAKPHLFRIVPCETLPEKSHLMSPGYLHRSQRILKKTSQSRHLSRFVRVDPRQGDPESAHLFESMSLSSCRTLLLKNLTVQGSIAHRLAVTY
jgi:hypothetical protein